MCVRRVGAVGLGGKHPDDSGIPTRSPVGVALSRARPPSALPARRPRPPHAPTERPPTVSLVYASDRRCTSKSQRHRSQMLPYRILNISIAIPQRHAKSRGLAEGSPIARSGLGTDPRVCSPTDPTGPDQGEGPRNEKKPWKKPHGRALQHQRPSPRSPKDRTESQKSSTSWERTGERIYRGERCEEVSMFISRPSSLT